ncbi:MAG: type II toxin-antitoxin system RelE/ParE family toxin [Desulfuromonadales bacterium]|nr:type II toxin-antitoxin system RelE/ParE family toxin [Desulfuromonadales bacterium]
MIVKPVEFAESAICDLEEILAWYAEQQVPDVGERLVQELFARTEQLAEFPESGRIVPEFDVKTIRELIHPPFRLVYRIDSTKIWIVRVWRSERLLRLP